MRVRGLVSLPLLLSLSRTQQEYVLTDQPGPPHHLLFGTLPAFMHVQSKAPKDLHPQAQMTMLQRLYKLGDMFTVDTWPLMDQMYLVANPKLAHQVSQDSSPFPKHPMITRFLKPLTGYNSVLAANDAKWKELRSLFAPGFSNAHLMTMVPLMVEKTEVFCDLLSEYAAKHELFSMEPMAARLTIDIIGIVVLGVDFQSLTRRDELVEAFRHLLDLLPNGQTLDINPVTHYLRRKYANTMDNYIRRVLRDRAANGANKKFRTLMDIAIERYEQLPNGSLFDCGFEQLAVDNLKTFVFAGHDTSSTTLSNIYHLLSKHPEALAKVIEEHDQVLGKDTAAIGQLIRDQPSIINKLPYTTAVIRETLRLYPASGSLRMAPKDTTFHPDKAPAVTVPKGSLIWVGIHTIHHDAEFFPCPDEFHPERFMTAKTITLADGRTEAVTAGWNGHAPPADAYRPFEKGPRMCIGSEMAMIEIRVVLAMTLRRFRFESAYAEYRRRHPDEVEAAGGRTEAFGDEAYQVFSSTAKPKSGVPMYVYTKE
ncbi:cytochrome P450 [Aspergillus brunneoviolaceus CBS 621.78]|uniref:Cytochrome P450 n=1 Tax=Aspergillus brunneoviolaceus CBS 621.78 TaxID=1450534 RepID=A0ACD1FZW6_9EURO|nr:cytochrome P450 [Aspergillus brunneoviolaceus CBS 621.78]RAH42519.1 cytochrome P450 [Aspergillus brunneoviolaceus CBS 621.78]